MTMRLRVVDDFQQVPNFRKSVGIDRCLIDAKGLVLLKSMHKLFASHFRFRYNVGDFLCPL